MGREVRSEFVARGSGPLIGGSGADAIDVGLHWSIRDRPARAVFGPVQAISDEQIRHAELCARDVVVGTQALGEVADGAIKVVLAGCLRDRAAQLLRQYECVLGIEPDGRLQIVDRKLRPAVLACTLDGTSRRREAAIIPHGDMPALERALARLNVTPLSGQIS